MIIDVGRYIRGKEICTFLVELHKFSQPALTGPLVFETLWFNYWWLGNDGFLSYLHRFLLPCSFLPGFYIVTFVIFLNVSTQASLSHLYSTRTSTHQAPCVCPSWRRTKTGDLPSPSNRSDTFCHVVQGSCCSKSLELIYCFYFSHQNKYGKINICFLILLLVPFSISYESEFLKNSHVLYLSLTKWTKWSFKFTL